jgi:hypothetical protein
VTQPPDQPDRRPQTTFRSPDADPGEPWNAPWLDDRAPGRRLIRAVWYTMVGLAILSIALVIAALVRTALSE